ncbi:ATP-dependent DNA helicase [Ottowia testudinis]|uniref:ATP-dependent DNA helicase n=1 Tax=Ottowia testudinis TaxID=2816950 RepID=A0A975CF76_9BURK|nr:ATP-dependent DNA helicase [Ottowia testudinis]QTD44439.1 ATP-dependent DNA helicase [Ottowia testudinis]
MTTPLQDAVQSTFVGSGALAQAAEGFVARHGQTQLAQAVARTIEQGGVLVAEAATGVGKTFAYLVPALLSGERVLLSTATKTLQDQLFGRDLPRLARALGVPVRTALLKGRGSYLCLHRLEFAGESAAASAPHLRHALSEVERWSKTTRTGDLAELPGLDERSPVIPLVTSTRENCLGADCPKFRACHVNLARREAMAADVVVINHHLFFADLAIRESGMAELLPTVRVAIFDEAHQLNETGIQFLGQQLATGQLLDFARDLLGAGLQQARGLCDWTQLASGVELAARDLRMTAGQVRGANRLRWTGAAPDGIDPADWQAALARLHTALTDAAAGLDTVSELAPDFVRLHERARALADRAQRFGAPCGVALVRWADISQSLRLMESPLDIADIVRTRLLAAPEGEGPARAWVFVSATLGDDARLSWFTQPCGLQDAEVLRIGSPFDYAQQAALYVPVHIARPADPAHSADVARLAGDAAACLGGRTMVLTTTLRALRSIGDALAERFAGGGIEVLVQGQLPKRVLMDRFRAGNADGRPGCVLVASASFWEGVDMPGDALQLVIIDKLPFPPPGDPLVEARCRRIESEGRSAFADYSVPEAAVALKQGAGRLIRRETDTGLLAICDTRLVQMGYGRRLLAALPPMRRLSSAAEFDAALAALRAAPMAEDLVSKQTPAPA